MEGKGGKFISRRVDFRSWHCGRQGGKSFIKNSFLDHGIVEGKGGSLNEDLEFRSWHCGRQGAGSLNKELG